MRSARFAGEDASDEQNLALLIDLVPAGSPLAYVCAIAYVDPAAGVERVFEGRCEGRMAAEPLGSGGFGYDPVFVPDGADGRTMAQLDAGAKGRDQPPRRSAAGARGVACRAAAAMSAEQPHAMTEEQGSEPKARAAALSVASNATLITLKVIAGIATGSVSVLTEAAHSGMDLIASLVAFVSVRKSGEPADADHPYGHEKMENLAGAIEGTLILFGAAIITYEALQRLVRGGRVHTIGVGIAVIMVSAVVNLVVSRIIARRARATGSVALEADAVHLSADVATSGAVLIGLVLVAATACPMDRPGGGAGGRVWRRLRRRADPGALDAVAGRRVAAAGRARLDPRDDPPARRRARRRRLPQAARPPSRIAELRRRSPAVRRRHDARGGARNRARADQRDSRPPQRR